MPRILDPGVTNIGPLQGTDGLPIERPGIDLANNTTVDDIAKFIILLHNTDLDPHPMYLRADINFVQSINGESGHITLEFAPPLTVNETYVTPDEKAAIHTHTNTIAIAAVEGTNTGDQDLSGLVPQSRTINSKPLTSDIVLTADNVGAAPSLTVDEAYVTPAQKTALHSHSNTAALGAVRGSNTGDQDLSGMIAGTRTINNKPLSGDIVLTPADLEAEPELGLPSADGMILQSSMAGLRTWIAGTEGFIPTVDRSIDVALGLSNIKLPTQNAVKQYVDTAIGNIKPASEWLDSVISEVDTAPSTPAIKDRYLVSTTPMGVFAGKATQVAEWTGTVWEFKVPTIGTFLSVDDDTTGIRYFGGLVWAVKKFELTTVGPGLNLIDGQLSLQHNITISTNSPSGGGDGDVWIKYTP